MGARRTRVKFDDDEFSRLKAIRKKHGLNWRGLLLRGAERLESTPPVCNWPVPLTPREDEVIAFEEELMGEATSDAPAEAEEPSSEPAPDKVETDNATGRSTRPADTNDDTPANTGDDTGDRIPERDTRPRRTEETEEDG